MVDSVSGQHGITQFERVSEGDKAKQLDKVSLGFDHSNSVARLTDGKGNALTAPAETHGVPTIPDPAPGSSLPPGKDIQQVHIKTHTTEARSDILAGFQAAVEADTSLLTADRLNTLNSVQLQLFALENAPEQTLQDIQTASSALKSAALAGTLDADKLDQLLTEIQTKLQDEGIKFSQEQIKLAAQDQQMASENNIKDMREQIEKEKEAKAAAARRRKKRKNRGPFGGFFHAVFVAPYVIIGQEIGKGLDTATKQVGAATNSAFRDVGRFMNNQQEFWKALGEDIEEDLTSLNPEQAFKDFGRLTKEGIENAASEAGRAFKEFGEDTEQAFTEFGKDTDKAFKDFGEDTDKAFKEFGQDTDKAFKEFGQDTDKAFKEFGQDTDKAFKEFGQDTDKAFKEFGQDTDKAFKEFGQDTDKAFKEFGQDTDKAFKEFGQDTDTFTDGKDKAFKEFGQDTDQAFTEFGKDTDKAFKEFGQDTDQAFTEFGKDTDKAFKDFAQDTDQAFTEFGKDTDKAFKDFAQDTDQAFTEFGKDTDKAFKDFAQDTDQAFTEFGKDTDKAFKDFGQDTEQAFTELGQTASDIYNALTGNTDDSSSSSSPDDTYATSSEGLTIAEEGMSQAEFMKLLEQQQIQEEANEKLQQAVLALQAGQPQEAARILGSITSTGESTSIALTPELQQFVDMYNQGGPQGTDYSDLSHNFSEVADNTKQNSDDALMQQAMISRHSKA